MGVVKELGFHGFSISKGKALGTKLLQATLFGFIWVYASLSQCLIHRLIGWFKGHLMKQKPKSVNLNGRLFSIPYSISSYLVVTFQVALSRHEAFSLTLPKSFPLGGLPSIFLHR